MSERIPQALLLEALDLADFVVRPLFVTVNGYAYCRADYHIPWRRLPGIFVWYCRFMPTMLRTIISQWQDDGLPTYLAAIQQWKKIDISTARDKQLLSGVRALAIADADYWFRVAMVMGIAKMTDGALHQFLSVFVKGELTSGMFLRGFPSKTLRAQADLEVIARRAQALETVRNLVTLTPAEKLIEILCQHADGIAIVADIQAYLEQYGHLIYTLDFAQETQIEDPMPILLSLKSLVLRQDADIAVEQESIIREREALTRSTLQSVGPIRRWIFRKLLKWAHTYGPYREEALFYVGAAWPTLRKFAQEVGGRLVDNSTFNRPSDVFYLDTCELEAACMARQAGTPAMECSGKVRQRRELRESRKNLHPPPMVPKGRFKFGIVDMSFLETQKRNKDSSNVLSGFAVSPGQVTGVASVIMSPTDFVAMRADTILVCRTTTPAWTPLFSQALALVTDIGGILAHGSIVAREYGIPAVMGTGNITQRIVSGQRICVNGDTGTVTILE